MTVNDRSERDLSQSEIGERTAPSTDDQVSLVPEKIRCAGFSSRQHKTMRAIVSLFLAARFRTNTRTLPSERSVAEERRTDDKF